MFQKYIEIKIIKIKLCLYLELKMKCFYIINEYKKNIRNIQYTHVVMNKEEK